MKIISVVPINQETRNLIKLISRSIPVKCEEILFSSDYFLRKISKLNGYGGRLPLFVISSKRDGLLMSRSSKNMKKAVLRGLETLYSLQLQTRKR
jgi:hypothetical protein